MMMSPMPTAPAPWQPAAVTSPPMMVPTRLMQPTPNYPSGAM